MKSSQNDKILAYLKKGRSLTPLTALKQFGCLRLSARIYDLISEGYPIISERVKGKSYSRYFLYAKYRKEKENERVL